MKTKITVVEDRHEWEKKQIEVRMEFISTLNLISKIVTHLNACFCFFLNVSDKVKRKGKALEMIQNNSK